MADNIFASTLDSDAGGNYVLVSWGVGETLTRTTPQMRIEPWLAQSLESIDPLTWRLTVRSDAVFHDGTPCDAVAVKASLERTLDKVAATTAFLPKTTALEPNGNVLTIRTPTPTPLLPNYLALWYFVIQKTPAQGQPVHTGSYIPRDFVANESATLVANAAYRGGPPRTAGLKLRFIDDVNARVLALQAGDVDLAQQLLPSHVNSLKAAAFKVESLPYSRQNVILLNTTRPPLDDVAVRRAVSLAIDRQLLIEGVMDGVGSPAHAIAPDSFGLPGIINTQRFDLAEAKRILDDAGWRAGSDGIRQKAGRALAFTLGSYENRAELPPLSVAIKDQLRAAGMDATLEKFPDINQIVANNAFEATMYSYLAIPHGDIQRALVSLFLPGATNRDRYSNERLNAIYEEYEQTFDAGRRQAMAQEMQEIIAQDVPVVYVINPYQIVAMSKKVSGYTPNAQEFYKYDAEVRIDG
ncbi:MAG: ABC transporter substrate-binding protein [Dehalococcoidia bacterium]